MSKLFVISAPSGAGKTSLVQATILRLHHYSLERVITYTTKQPRSMEKQGIDYHFISHDEFQAKIEQSYFLEWTCYNDTYYGSPNSILDKLQQNIAQIVILDRIGAQQVLAKIPQAVLIWIHTVDINTLRTRLMHRNTETEDQIERRLLIAQHELAAELCKPLYKYHVLNDSFEQAVLDMHDILAKELIKKIV